MENLKKYIFTLKQNDLFFEDSEEEILESLKVLDAEFASYSKGDILHRTGKPLLKFGLVVYGCVEVLTNDIEGNAAIMADVTPGITFGESLCVLKKQDPDIYIVANEDSGIVWLSADKFFSDTTSSLIIKLEKRFVKMIAKRTLSMNNRIQILSKLTLREKIITYFTFLSQNQKSDRIEIPFNREDMAIYFGTNRSALSREISKMRKEGLIDFSKNKFLLNFKK